MMSDSITYRRHRYEVHDDVIHRDGAPISRAAALREAAPGSALREWLRERGVSLRTSGPGGAESRRTVEIKLRLSREDAALLDSLAGGEPRNTLVSRWIRAAAGKAT